MTEELLPEGSWAPGSIVRTLFADLAHGGAMVGSGGRAPSSAEGLFSGEAGSREQGVLVCVQLRLSAADRTVREMRYRAFGCPYTLAACEWLARELSGRALSSLSGPGLAAAVGTAADWGRALDIPQRRLGRLLVIEDALYAALAAAGSSPRAAKPIAVAAVSDNP